MTDQKTIDKNLNLFKQFCDKEGLRITKPRTEVFKHILASDKPQTAYDIIDALKKPLDNPKPPTIYRALEFLTENAFIHRIESLNAYISCIEGHRHKGSQFMICDICQNVEEIHLCHLPPSMENKITENKFNLKYWNIEVHGQCSNCQA